MKRFFFVTICILGGLFLSSVVLALTVSPVRIEIAGDPGTIIKGKIMLMNDQEGTRTFYSSFGNFEATGETGTPSFVSGDEGLATWIETAPSIILGSGEEKEAPYTITIPQDADPGGHFAAIFWGTSPSKTEGGGQVSIGAKLGVLVLLKVSGEIEEGGRILEFSTDNKQNSFNSLPIKFFYRFQNGGSDRIKPSGEITIKNIFGGTSAVLSANEFEGNILPQSIRKFEVIWEKTKENDNTIKENNDEGLFKGISREWNNFAFGRYTAKLNLEYGASKEIAQSSFSFWVFPWRILLLIVLILAIMVLLFTKGIKRYNQWIIAKARSKI